MTIKITFEITDHGDNTTMKSGVDLANPTEFEGAVAASLYSAANSIGQMSTGDEALEGIKGLLQVALVGVGTEATTEKSSLSEEDVSSMIRSFDVLILGTKEMEAKIMPLLYGDNHFKKILPGQKHSLHGAAQSLILLAVTKDYVLRMRLIFYLLVWLQHELENSKDSSKAGTEKDAEIPPEFQEWMEKFKNKGGKL